MKRSKKKTLTVYNQIAGIYISAIFIIAILFAPSLSAQPYEPFTQITDDNFEKMELAMHGDYLVYWRTNIAKDNGIFLYHIPTGATTTITSGTDAQFANLDIWGDRVVWQQYGENDWDIYNYLISRPDLGAYPLIDYDGYQGQPAIYDDLLVYVGDGGVNYHSDVYLYDISAATVKKVTSQDQFAQSDPDIYGNYIVWADGRNGNQDIYMYDIYNQEEIPITDDEADQRNPCIWKNRIVWEDRRNVHWDLYMHVINWFPDIEPVEYNQPVFTGNEIGYLNMFDQVNPQISDHYIIFQDNRNYQWDIFLYTFINPIVGITTPLVEEPMAQTMPVIEGHRAFWLDGREYTGSGFEFNNIWMWEKPPGVDLTLYIEDDPDPVESGAELTLRTVVSNLGDQSAYDPLFSFKLPTGVEFISMDGFGVGGYSRVGDSIYCYLDSIPAGKKDTVTIVARPVIETTMKSKAWISAQETDIDASNNFYRCETKVIWKVPTEIGTGGNPSIDTDLSGRAHLAFLSSPWGGMLHYGTAVNGYSSSVVIDSSEYNWSPAIAIDRSNHVHIAYSQGSEMTNEHKKLYYITNKTGTWSSPEIIAEDVGSGESICIQLDSRDSVHVSCMTSLWAMGALQYYTRNNGWSKTYTRESTYNSSSFALDTSDFAHFSFYDLSAGGLRYSTNAPDGVFGPEESPDDNWHGGQMESLVTDIAIDKNSVPHLSYVGSVQDWSNEDYKYAYKSAGWQDIKIDDGYFAGGWNAIDTDPFNEPHICYLNTLSDRLKYAWKEENTWHHKIIDYFSGGDPGIRILDIAMDRNGYTHIIYSKKYQLLYVTNTEPVPEPIISVQPTTLDFHDRVVGDTTDAKKVVIRNNGEGDLVINDVRIAWRDSASFSISNTTCNVIPPGDTCSIDVRFNPTIIGNKQALLWIESNDPLNPIKSVSLKGQGMEGYLNNLGYNYFGEVALGDSVRNEYILKNVGNISLVIQGMYLQNGDDNDFYYSGLPSIPFSIDDGDSIIYYITFKPTAEGERTIVQRIYSTSMDITAELSGTGFIPTYDVQGEIRLPDNSLVDQGWIWMINLEENSPYHTYHYKPLEGATSFTFIKVPEITVTFHFDPDETAFPGYIRTYYGDVPFRESATALDIDHDISNIQITLLEAPESGDGTGSVSGSMHEENGGKKSVRISNATYQGEGTPLDSVPVYLVNMTGNIVHADVTDEQGEFDFTQIAQGEYLLKADYLGYPMSADNDTLKISSENAVYEIVAVVSDEEIASSITKVTGINEASILRQLKVYPNPFSEYLTIHTGINGEETLSYQLKELSGRTLRSGVVECSNGRGLIRLDTEALNPGCYLLGISIAGQEEFVMVIRQ